MERKSLPDLVTSLTSGRLRFALGELAALPRAAVVVEDRYSQIFNLDRVRPAPVADGLAELQVRWPTIPIVFCETRKLGRGVDLPLPRRRARLGRHGTRRLDRVASIQTRRPRHRRPRATAAEPAAPAPSTAEVRAWARHTGSPCPTGAGCAPRSTRPGTPPTGTPTTNPAATICPSAIRGPSLGAHG